MTIKHLDTSSHSSGSDSSSSDSSPSAYVSAEDVLLQKHLVLLSMDASSEAGARTAGHGEEIANTPLFTAAVSVAASSAAGPAFPQHSLLAGILTPRDGDEPSTAAPASSPDELSHDESAGRVASPAGDPRIFLNVNAPWSAFICGSQGSGKSHTLSCMLESCLLASPELGNKLPHPLAGVVFHYDKHSSLTSSICEAAYLCSSGIPVRVLVPESNKTKLQSAYDRMKLPGGTRKPVVQVLKFKEKHINVERMMSLMSVSSGDHKPLYIEVSCGEGRAITSCH